jgi:hypothetical protein
MPRTFALLLTLAALSAGALAQTGQVGQNATPNTIQSQPAPIVRNPQATAWPRVTTTQPVAGVWLQTDQNSTAKIISADANKTEIRIDRGRGNVQVHHPAGNSQILVDLPGGQTTLLKDGLYTFNAETNTVRVLRGEAEVYPGAANSTAKPIKVKEDHELSFLAGTNGLKSREADRQELMSDLFPGGRPGSEGNGSGYGYRPYGDGYSPYPYGYPYLAYGWGSPYGWGYPYGFGVGFGYYGGFRGRFR